MALVTMIIDDSGHFGAGGRWCDGVSIGLGRGFAADPIAMLGGVQNDPRA